MSISSYNPGYNYSSHPYMVEDIPEKWFELINNFSEQDYNGFLEGFYIWTAAASWYNSNGENTKMVELGFSLKRRYIYVNDETKPNPIFFTFYDKPFDIRTSLGTFSSGEPIGIITVNSHQNVTKQLKLMLYIGDKRGIENYNHSILLLSYGDRLLAKGYDIIKSQPVYCNSFASIYNINYANLDIPTFTFNKVHCLRVDTNGKISYKSYSKLSNTINYSKQLVRAEKETISEKIHRGIQYSIENNTFDEPREKIVFDELDYTRIIRFEPITLPYIDTYGKSTNDVRFNSGFTFKDLFMCKRIGAIPEENKIISFANNHYNRFEFQFENKYDYFRFGKLLLYLRKLYLSLKNELAYEESCYDKVESGVDIGFFLQTSEDNDEHIFIDPNTIELAENSNNYDTPIEHLSHPSTSKEEIENPITESAVEELESLIGLASVKKDVLELSSLVQLNIKRKEYNLPTVPVSLHLVFTGNPGTGKTTVARILARIYKELGVLSQGQLVEVDRSTLVAGYVGQTALKTQEKIQEAMGGILFVDEAYTLAKDGNDFGQEAIDTILKAMEDKRDEFVVIVAGYPDLMHDFVNSNPGLKSRFNKYFYFEDYTADELYEIFMDFCNKYSYHLDSKADEKIREIIKKMIQEKDTTFANARDIRNIFERTISKQSTRVAKMRHFSKHDALLIKAEDLNH